MIKRIFKYTVFLLIMTSLIISTTTFAEEESSEWAEESIEALSYYADLPEDTFMNYFQNITREEFMSYLVRSYLLMTYDYSVYDVNLDDYSFDDTDSMDVKVARYLGFTNGTGDNKFDPTANVSREVLATYFYRVIETADVSIDYETTNTYEDHQNINDWSSNAVYFFKAKEILLGDNNNNFLPQELVTKEMILTVMNRVLQKYSRLGKLSKSGNLGKNEYDRWKGYYEVGHNDVGELVFLNDGSLVRNFREDSIEAEEDIKAFRKKYKLDEKHIPLKYVPGISQSRMIMVQWSEEIGRYYFENIPEIGTDDGQALNYDFDTHFEFADYLVTQIDQLKVEGDYDGIDYLDVYDNKMMYSARYLNFKNYERPGFNDTILGLHWSLDYGINLKTYSPTNERDVHYYEPTYQSDLYTNLYYFAPADYAVIRSILTFYSGENWRPAYDQYFDYTFENYVENIRPIDSDLYFKSVWSGKVQYKTIDSNYPSLCIGIKGLDVEDYINNAYFSRFVEASDFFATDYIKYKDAMNPDVYEIISHDYRSGPFQNNK